MILKKVCIENPRTQEIIYSKLVRGGLDFTIEVHTINTGHTLSIYLYRNNARTKQIIEAAQRKDCLTETFAEYKIEKEPLKFKINDQIFMINNIGEVNIKVHEQNFSPKGFRLIDFDNGKIAILIDFNFKESVDNSQLKKELQNYFKEEKNGRTNKTNTK